MFGKRILPLALMALLVIALFNIVSSSAYRAGWSQGYSVGQATTGSEEDAPPPAPYAGYGPYGRGGPGWGFSPFWGLGLFFKFFLFLILLAAISRFFFFRRWGRWHGPWDRHSHRHHDYHGHKPPWDQDDAEEPVMKA